MPDEKESAAKEVYFDFLSILDSEDIEVKQKLIYKFTTSFRDYYKRYNDETIKYLNNLKNCETFDKYKSQMGAINSLTNQSMLTIIAYLEKSRKESPIKQSELLGCSLGAYLGTLEPQFLQEKIGVDFKGYQENFTLIFHRSEEIVNLLKQINKKIKMKFLKKRIEKISKINGVNLPKEAKIFIAKL